VNPKQLQPWAQVNHILVFKITHQVDINFPVGSGQNALWTNTLGAKRSWDKMLLGPKALGTKSSWDKMLMGQNALGTRRSWDQLAIFVHIGIGKVGKLFSNQGNPLF
jgi:hypothetical protein